MAKKKKKKKPIGKLDKPRASRAAARDVTFSTGRGELRRLVSVNWKAGSVQKQLLKDLILEVGTPEERCLLKMLQKAGLLDG